MKSLYVIALLALSVGAHARKPAVEDFIGIEPESTPTAPVGTETLYNFGTEISDYKEAPFEVTVIQTNSTAVAPVQASGWSFSAWWAVGAVLLLPLAAWRLVMRKVEELPVANNVTELAAHRRKKVEDFKKAS